MNTVQRYFIRKVCGKRGLKTHNVVLVNPLNYAHVLIIP